jgi:hypothetical protein
MSHSGAGAQGNPGTGAAGAGTADPPTGANGAPGGSGSSGGTGDGGDGSFDGNAALGALLGDNSGGQGQGGSGDGGQGGSQGGAAGADPNANLTVEQQLENERSRSRQLQLAAREQEKRAKAGAAAIKRLQDLDDAQKTEAQRAAEGRLTAERERDEARAETHRLLAAAKHGITPEMIEFLGTGTEDEIDARAETLSEAIKKAAADLIAANGTGNRSGGLPGVGRNGFPGGNRPIESLRPGGTPAGESGQYGKNDAFRALLGR